MGDLNKKDLLYPDLSYELIGILFEVYNELGPGHKEKYYENAVAVALKKHNIKYKRQLYIPLKFKDKIIGKYYIDFLIEDKIVLELKTGSRFSRKNINQVLSYLKAHNLKLGIIAQFASDDVKFKRIVNLDNS